MKTFGRPNSSDYRLSLCSLFVLIEAVLGKEPSKYSHCRLIALQILGKFYSVTANHFARNIDVF